MSALLRAAGLATVIALLSPIALADDCVDCHMKETPSIVNDWEISRHHTEEVDCRDCHKGRHKSADDVDKLKTVTAETCAKCHEERFEQFAKGKHALAWASVEAMPTTHALPMSLAHGMKGCGGCHKLGLKDEETIEQLKAEGSMFGHASCDACHTRHTFSVVEAQQPQACQTCHMGFDHPQWEMYTSAKHGIIWGIEGHEEDARAPTCQSCHMMDGSHSVKTPWGFLALRIPTKENVLALIDVAPSLKEQLTKLASALPSGHYMDLDDDPQWTFDRALILQAAGVLDANLQPTERCIELVVQAQVARGPEEFNEIRTEMKANCNKCHSKGFVDSHMKASDEIIKAADSGGADNVSVILAKVHKSYPQKSVWYQKIANWF